MRPESYRKLDCCANCIHVFERPEIDENTEYFCHIDKSDRPPCDSSLLEETIIYLVPEYRKHRDKVRQMYKDWTVWSIQRRVESFGYCLLHKKSKSNG